MTDPAEALEISLLPEDDASEEPEGSGAGRRSLVVVLAAALVVALAVAGGLGVTLWRDRVLPGKQDQVAAVVDLYTRSFDQHDLGTLRTTLADRGSFASGENLAQPAIGPLRGQELDEFYRGLFRAKVQLSSDGPPQITGSGPYRVAVKQTVRYTVAGVAVTEQAVSLFTVLQLRDRPVILEHVWWRPLAAQAPSMLWSQ